MIAPVAVDRIERHTGQHQRRKRADRHTCAKRSRVVAQLDRRISARNDHTADGMVGRNDGHPVAIDGCTPSLGVEISLITRKDGAEVWVSMSIWSGR